MSQKQINTRMIIGVITVVLAIASLLLTVPSLASAIFAKSIDSQSGQDDLIVLLTDHEEDIDTYLNRFEGRSMFFRPPPFPVVKEPKAPIADPTPVTPIKTGPPPTYGGPKVLGAYGQVVWFKDNLKVRVGEEGGGVKVLEINAPWTVKLGHKDGEYDVPIFSDRLTDSDEFSSPLDLKSLPGVTFDDDPADSDNSGDNKKRERLQQ